MYECLTRTGPLFLVNSDDLEPLPNLAKSWDLCEDGMQLTINLIEGAADPRAQPERGFPHGRDAGARPRAAGREPRQRPVHRAVSGRTLFRHVLLRQGQHGLLSLQPREREGAFRGGRARGHRRRRVPEPSGGRDVRGRRAGDAAPQHRLPDRQKPRRGHRRHDGRGRHPSGAQLAVGQRHGRDARFRALRLVRAAQHVRADHGGAAHDRARADRAANRLQSHGQRGGARWT